MPKELHVVEDAIARGPGSDANLPREYVRNPRVEVGWNKAHIDGHASVSIRLSADLMLAYESDDSATVGSDLHADEDIRAVICSRADINRIIQMLRKARDSAYGKDQ